MTKVLVCSEFSQIGSGYAIYTKELLQGFKQRGIEFAELASFCRVDDSRIRNCDWKVYPVIPHPHDTENDNIYKSHPANVFGRHLFESVLIDYKPTHVIDVRDVWNLTHEYTSPLRDYYAHIIMPAVDSDPQNKQWLDMYNKSDAVVTYCDWATQLLRRCGVSNVVGHASPVPPVYFKPMPEKPQLQASLGLGDITVIGTVMRNQPRKLFPQLFRMFRKLLDSTKRSDVYLYCHTSYPDIWELDELLLEHNIGHKVLFTYGCSNCGYVETSFYKGPFAYCTKCQQRNTLRLPNTMNPISGQILNQVYNIFDIYIQYASLEGYGIPVAEAIAAQIPTLSINYSAMETFIKEGGSIPIEVSEYHIEPETGRRFAIPDESDALNKLTTLLNTSKDDLVRKAKLNRLLYGMRDFGEAVDVWVEAINRTKPKVQWNAPKRHYNKPTTYPANLSSAVFAKWLILHVLQDPSYIGSVLEARLVRDLEHGHAFVGHDNKYYYEALNIPNQRYQPFNQDIAFKHFTELLSEKIVWEQKRVEM